QASTPRSPAPSTTARADPPRSARDTHTRCRVPPARAATARARAGGAGFAARPTRPPLLGDLARPVMLALQHVQRQRTGLPRMSFATEKMQSRDATRASVPLSVRRPRRPSPPRDEKQKFFGEAVRTLRKWESGK